MAPKPTHPRKPVERRLAAILNADVVGYTRLMADDEVATLETLNAYRGVLAGLVRQHGGRVVDMVGDNLLAEFPSAVDAVQCAVEAQLQFAMSNTKLNPMMAPELLPHTAAGAKSRACRRAAASSASASTVLPQYPTGVGLRE